MKRAGKKQSAKEHGFKHNDDEDGKDADGQEWPDVGAGQAEDAAGRMG